MTTLGRDPRREWTPAERARAEAITAQYGGTLTTTAPARPLGGMSLEWDDGQGDRIQLHAENAGALVGLLARVAKVHVQMRAGDTTSNTGA
jgi:hypothetical protein